MRLAVALGGTDLGRSGIGVCVRAVVPRLLQRVEASGGALIALGTREELRAYDHALSSAERVTVGALWRPAWRNALWHLMAAGDAAARAGAEVLLLPAANRRATARCPIPVVAVVHDLAQLHVPGKYDALRTAYLRGLVGWALGSADELVAVSEATRRDLARALGRSAAAARVVPNGVDVERFTPTPSDDPRRRAAHARCGLDRPYLLYLARLEHPGKNHLRLLRAFARSQASASHRLVLAGADWGALQLLTGELARLALRDRVLLPGYVPDDLVPALVAGADGVLMMGVREGFGLPALEALAAGRPLAIARTGALPEVAGHLAATCDPLDEASIAAAIDRLVDDRALRERAAREGPGHARARSWDATADGLLAACRAASARGAFGPEAAPAS
jgi:glycosyltransferase involved in cell wall biosynthesis